MKKSRMDHRAFLFALLFVLIGALLLGMLLFMTLYMGMMNDAKVIRDQKIGIYEDSEELLSEVTEIDPSDAVPTETHLPQKAETAEDVFAIVKHAAEILGCPPLPEEYEVAYVEAREPIPDYIEPAHWVVSQELTGYEEETETQPFRSTSSVYYKATVDPKTGRMIEISYLDYIMRLAFAEQGTSTAADGEAILQEHAEYLDFAVAHICALYPSERNVRAKLKSVSMERGHLNVHVYVNTDADGVYIFGLMRKDGALINTWYKCVSEQEWDAADPTFTNYDADGWWL